MSINCDIRTFSSYAKGLHTVLSVAVHAKFVELELRLPLSFQSKIEKRNEKLKCSALSIDGVYAQISFIKSKITEIECFEIIAKIAKDLFLNSSLTNLEQGSKVNVGMISKNREKWLLDSSPIGIVKLNNTKIADGHTFTKEFCFECSKEVFEQIQKLQYIGINGSGLILREPHRLDGHYYFSIHAGKKTRETTVFEKDDLTPGKEFTLTRPFTP